MGIDERNEEKPRKNEKKEMQPGEKESLFFDFILPYPLS